MANMITVNVPWSGQRDVTAARRTTVDACLLFDGRVLHTTADAIRLASCRQFETIVVTTRRSVYEIVVLHGEAGDVLVRGGSGFPEFRRALFVGSTADGRALKVNTIDIGLRMELHLGDGSVVTSAVTAVSRTALRMDDPSLT